MPDPQFRLVITVPSVAFTLDKSLMRKTLRAAGAEVAAAARALVRGSTGGGHRYGGPGGSAGPYRGGYKPGAYTASGPGQAPVSVTGTLARSIKVRALRGGDAVQIRDLVFYAKFLEAGARGGRPASRPGHAGNVAGGKGVRNKRRGAVSSGRVLMPRPFLSAALAARQESIGGRVQEALLSGIAFKRMK